MTSSIPEPDYAEPEAQDVVHVSVRAFERYGLVMSNEDQDDIADQIHRQHAYFLAKASSNTSVFMVYWREAGRVVPVLYNRKRKRVTTILPKQIMVAKNPQIIATVDRLIGDPVVRSTPTDAKI